MLAQIPGAAGILHHFSQQSLYLLASCLSIPLFPLSFALYLRALHPFPLSPLPSSALPSFASFSPCPSPCPSEVHGVAGAAVEHRTLLGRILRVSPEPREDPKMREMFQDAHRQPRNIVEGHTTTLRYPTTPFSSLWSPSYSLLLCPTYLLALSDQLDPIISQSLVILFALYFIPAVFSLSNLIPPLDSSLSFVLLSSPPFPLISSHLLFSTLISSLLHLELV